MTIIEKYARPGLSIAGLRFWDDELAMRMEEFVEDDQLVLRAELPGVDPEKDLSITVAEGALTIAAERKDEHTEGEKGKPGYHSEFRYGSFHRRMLLPAGVGADAVTATYRDGILEVRMPNKPAEAQAKSVPVKRS